MRKENNCESSKKEACSFLLESHSKGLPQLCLSDRNVALSHVSLEGISAIQLTNGEFLS